MYYVSFTTDFECLSPSISGNAVIDIDKQMILPARKLAKIAVDYGCRVTFFLEVIQWERFHHIQDYQNQIKALDRLLLDLYQEGHDIQIHAHSEWVTARYLNGKWFRSWAGPDHVHDIMPEFLPIFDDALERLRNLLSKTYRPICYRAGGYMIDPIEPIFKILKQRGILADSSRHNENFTGLIIEGGMISLPVLGNYPTRDRRWDMNLSWRSPFYLFDKKQDINNCETKFAVMIGHTKLPHYWETIRNMFHLVETDSAIIPATVTEQINLIQSLYRPELDGTL
jgi:hypothetical protein